MLRDEAAPQVWKSARFIELPKHGKNYYPMFIEDIIKANIDTIFPLATMWTAATASRFRGMRTY